MKKSLCECGSGMFFKQCCQPLLDGEKIAKTPQQLMRSRYCAFAVGGYGAYLLKTWLPDSSIGLGVAELSIRSVNWQRLEVIEKSQKDDLGTVEFKAHFLDVSSEKHIHHEISQFVRRGGRWLYTEGEILS